MSDDSQPTAMRRRANITFASLLGVGIAVFALVTLLSGEALLGALYGLAPGLTLSVLGRMRVLRRDPVSQTRRPHSRDRGPA